MRLLVLAGGFGTRLKKELNGKPKPLADINGTPFLQLQIDKWVQNGATEITFLLYYESQQIISFLSENKEKWKNCDLNWIVEPKPLGTGGAICFAVQKLMLEGSFLVANADTFLSGGFKEIWSCKSPSMLVKYSKDTGRYGAISDDEDGFVTDMREKQLDGHEGYINAGLYHFSAPQFQEWDGEAVSLENTILNNFIKNKMLRTCKVSLDFIDIGVPEDYKNFCAWHLDGQTRQLSWEPDGK